MSNNLSSDEISQIRELAAAGNSLRKISRDLGVSKNTVSKYAKGQFGLCKCGRAAGHKGWCTERYKASEARQAYHAGRRGIHLPVREAPIRSRQQTAKAEKSDWLEMPRSKASPIPRGLHLRAIGDVRHACRRVRVPEKEDVVQHMTLSVIDGFLPFEDIPRAIPTFIGYHMRAFAFAFSLNDVSEGGMEFMGMISQEDAEDRWENLYSGVGLRKERETRLKAKSKKIKVTSTHSR